MDQENSEYGHFSRGARYRRQGMTKDYRYIRCNLKVI